MRRHSITPRLSWQKKVERAGLTYHSANGAAYWDESVYWEFTPQEIDHIEQATAELQKMCLSAAGFVLEGNRPGDLRVPPAAAALIRQTWLAGPPSLYGRMDLAFNRKDLKLLEYNAETPTSLVEAAVARWCWLEDRFPDADQFNFIHEALIARWGELAGYLREPVYFACEPFEEDWMTISYLPDTAQQAGFSTSAIAVQGTGWHQGRQQFVDEMDRPMGSIFKLYPWESLITDRFGARVVESANSVRWIEPAWKMLWSNKALPAILWEMYPGHELRLPAYPDGPRHLSAWVRKPLLGREGANVTVNLGGKVAEETDGRYRDDTFVFQEYFDLAAEEGKRVVLGSWLVDGEPCGMGIREPDSYVTSNTSRFVPHLFR